ncbi:ACSL4 [Cordylochernes scorpioides]|uniref:ACSL4 n=1 Tax=Cordylochernes scorpioides TaxID=51811 RepID=A0ABY6KS90_9ARAC|nr:ACSL4 [Cordylochernes scorpioides]
MKGSFRGAIWRIELEIGGINWLRGFITDEPSLPTFFHNIVTLFSTLSEEGVVHCLNETDVEYIITSADLMERLEMSEVTASVHQQKLLPNLPKLKKLVYMEGPQVSTCPDLPQLETAMSFSSFEDLADTLSTGTRISEVLVVGVI